jgi:hypothetical protein
MTDDAAAIHNRYPQQKLRAENKSADPAAEAFPLRTRYFETMRA